MKQIAFSRYLRRGQTDAEREIWALLRSRRLADYKFRRQEVTDGFIVDFCCFKEKLVIELDGSQHLEQEEYDRKRTEHLESQGFRILRFWNDQALKQSEAVLEMILEVLHITPSPPPFPALRGEREKEEK